MPKIAILIRAFSSGYFQICIQYAICNQSPITSHHLPKVGIVGNPAKGLLRKISRLVALILAP